MSTLDQSGDLYYPQGMEIDLQPVMRRVYVWMGLGTLLTALVAYLTISTSLLNLALSPVALIVALVAEFGIVLALSWGLRRLSTGTATFMFFVYAALNGFTLSVVLLAFTTATVVPAFVATAALFGAMSVIGYTTRVDLTRMGTYLMMALIGLIIAMVANVFISNGVVDSIISLVGVLIFTALTAYDTQRIARMAGEMAAGGDSAGRLAVFGALRLYLDFINMFLFMLRLMGGRRRS